MVYSRCQVDRIQNSCLRVLFIWIYSISHVNNMYIMSNKTYWKWWMRKGSKFYLFYQSFRLYESEKRLFKAGFLESNQTRLQCTTRVRLPSYTIEGCEGNRSHEVIQYPWPSLSLLFDGQKARIWKIKFPSFIEHLPSILFMWWIISLFTNFDRLE